MTFSEWVRKQKPNASARHLAKRALAELSESAIIPILAQEIDHVRRESVRAREAKQMHDFFRSGAGTIAPPSVAPEMFASPFAVGDGSDATWGEATVEQHRARVAILRNMVAGTQRTIGLHERAIEVLEATGARCLNELGGPAAIETAAALAEATV